MGALVVTIIISVLLMDLVIMPMYIHLGSETELPDVTESSYSEAKQILKDAGFKIIKEREIFEATYPESTIIYQNPPPYSQVKKGRRVYVTMSAGEKMVIVPNIVGLSERDAHFQLRQAGLQVADASYFDYDSYHPKGVVMSQSLIEGSEVKALSTIALTVSNGAYPTEFFVPDVCGKSLKMARQMLRQNGLYMGVIEYRVRKDLIPDTVVEQGIDGGTEVEQGISINLVVTKLEEDTWQ